jgi:hypothetical protein
MLGIDLMPARPGCISTVSPNGHPHPLIRCMLAPIAWGGENKAGCLSLQTTHTDRSLVEVVLAQAGRTPR